MQKQNGFSNTHSIHGTNGIFTYICSLLLWDISMGLVYLPNINGWFLWDQLVGKYTPTVRPMDP